ncbi:hypothetical protein HanHA300_Chr14g0522331 [Helianthus annuus]|nr:hypothetical protein HanHA300_Chr14g0522331 [Helianthus annuus]KAJ0468394.1 hypothetical protein HanIR_Chr14g0696131 [Helianthus annuus]KAJ0485564.1 hypothetical protein HanHA89_Chr14g0569751 [Helianthus annuus]KAJ0656116.1 hypothetical protein HanLR1_Chr14g0532141 [Helianthus annuus]
MRAETTTRDHDSQPPGCEWATRSRVGLMSRNHLGRNPQAQLVTPCINPNLFPTCFILHTNTLLKLSH